MGPDEAAVLAANDAFYEAFAAGDPRAMEQVWAHRAPVACVHPGWPALHGRSAVLESWRGILESPDAPAIACADAQAYVQGQAAFVICTERLEAGELVATNIFVREGADWKMVHHQAGPAPSPRDDVSSETVH